MSPKLREYVHGAPASDLPSIAFMAGVAYDKGHSGIEIDVEKAKYFLSVAASNGKAAASIWLYDYYFKRNEIRLALLLLEQSCEQSVDGHSCLLTLFIMTTLTL